MPDLCIRYFNLGCVLVSKLENLLVELEKLHGALENASLCRKSRHRLDEEPRLLPEENLGHAQDVEKCKVLMRPGGDQYIHMT